jgi:hypothetical protein
VIERWAKRLPLPRIDQQPTVTIEESRDEVAFDVPVERR